MVERRPFFTKTNAPDRTARGMKFALADGPCPNYI